MSPNGARVEGKPPLNPPGALREEKLRRFLSLLIAYQALAQIGAALSLLSATTPVDRTTERTLLALATGVLLLSGTEALVIRSRRETPLRKRHLFVGTVVLLTIALNLGSAVLLPQRTLFVPALDLFGICLITMAALVTAIYGTRAGVMTFACAAALQVAMATINGYTLTSIGWSQLVARLIWVGLGVLAAYGVMGITDELEIATRDVGERIGQLRAIDIMHDRALQDLKAMLMAGHALGDPKERLAHVLTIASNLDQYVRSWPSAGPSEGAGPLHEILTQTARSFNARSLIEFSFVTNHTSAHHLSDPQTTRIAEAVRLACANADDHSRATRVTIRCAEDSARVVVTVYDDGCGFDIRSASGRGIGIAQIQRALERAGGSSALTSTPSVGTRWEFSVPLVDVVQGESR